MKTAEIILGIVAIILFLSTFFIKDATIIFSIYLIPYAIFYFFASIPIIFNKKTNDIFYGKEDINKKIKYIAFAVATGFNISNVLVSITFKLLKWPGYSYMFKMSLFFMIILLGIAIVYFIKTKKYYFRRVIIRMFIFILVAVYFLYLY